MTDDNLARIREHSKSEPAAFLRTALQAAIATATHLIAIEASAKTCSLKFKQDGPNSWTKETLEDLSAALQGGLDELSRPDFQLAQLCCELTSCRPDLRLQISIAGGARALVVDCNGSSWGPGSNDPELSSFTFERVAPRPHDGQVKIFRIDLFAPLVSTAWPELTHIHDGLFDPGASVTLNGVEYTRDSLNPVDFTTPTLYMENPELFRLAIVHREPRLNTLQIAAQTRESLKGLLRPLVFVCVYPDGEVLRVEPGSVLRAYAGLTLHASPILWTAHLRGEVPVPYHIFRILKYGHAIYQSQEIGSTFTRVILDGSDVPTDEFFERAVEGPELQAKRSALPSLYQLATRSWRHNIDHDEGWKSILMGHHRSTLDAFEASLRT